MDTVLKQRLMGAIVLIGLGVIFLPMLFNEAEEDINVSARIPTAPAKPMMQTIITLQPKSTVTEQHVVKPHSPESDIALAETIAKKAENNVASMERHLLSNRKEISNEDEMALSIHKSPSTVQQSKKQQPPALKYKATPVGQSKPNPQKAIEGASAWVVQLGSFTDMTNVQLIQKQLRKKGITTFTHKITTSKGILTRVFAGPVIKHEQAVDLQTQLEKTSHITGKVTPYIPKLGMVKDSA